MPSMHSSNHMHHLTLNILKIAEVFLRNKFTEKMYEEKLEKTEPRVHQTQDAIEVIKLESDLEDILSKLSDV